MLKALIQSLRKHDPRVLGIALQQDYLAVVLVEFPSEAARGPVLLQAELLPLGPAGDPGEPLSDWVERAEARGVVAHVVLPEQSCRLLQIDAPEVPDEELRQAATWAVRDLIDYPLEQAVVDIFPPARSVRRSRPQVNVVAGHRATISELASRVRKAHVRLRGLGIRELAQRNLMRRLPESRGGSGLLVLGEQGGLLTLYRDGELVLARAFKVGLALLEQDMEQGANALQLELQRSLDYHESTLGQPPLSMLHLYPANDDTDAFAEWASGNFPSLAVRSIRMRDLVDVDPELLLQEDPGLLLALGAALGAGE